MAKRRILTEGNEILKKVSREIVDFTPELHLLLDDLKDTLEASGNGVGLAAPQVGILKRIAIVVTEEKSIELINPVISNKDGVQTGPEGCLSCPGEFGIVPRAMNITVTYRDRDGNFCEEQAEGFLARVIQHETDHLDGILFKSKATRMLEPDELESGE